MKLDYVDQTGMYVLHVPRTVDNDVVGLVKQHGLDFSKPASTPGTAVLFTKDEYAAVSFFKHATPKAKKRLAYLNKQIQASMSEGSKANIASPDGFELYPFQKAGVEYCMSKKHSLIGDEMGVGKTPQAICLANEMQAKSVLVICPASIRLQWATRIREWSTMKGSPIIYPILKSGDGVHPNANWTIISYNLCNSKEIFEALKSCLKPDLVILDEAHYLKTPTAKRTRAILGPGSLTDGVGMVVGLTGTPLPNRPRECFTLASNLCHESIDWMDKKEFEGKFNPSRVVVTNRGRHSEESVGRLPELRNRLRSNFMVRRLLRNVMKQLPEVRPDIVYLEENGAVRAALKAERMLDIDPNILTGLDAKILGHVSVVRKMMGVAMAPLVADYVDIILSGSSEKVFVWGWHLEVLDIIQERLKKYGVLRIDGSIPTPHRQRCIDEFQSNPQKRVFLGNKAVGEGVDGLQNVASHFIGAECSWVPGDNEQAVGRLYRNGQEFPVLAEFCTVPGSFSDRILGASLKKMKHIHTALDQEH